MMQEKDNMLIELIVPKPIVHKLKTLAELKIESSQSLQTNSLKFGVVEVTTILALVKTGLDLVEAAIKIWRIIKESGEDEAIVQLRSISNNKIIKIKADKTEQSVRSMVEDNFLH